jgi:hypothetical protein
MFLQILILNLETGYWNFNFKRKQRKKICIEKRFLFNILKLKKEKNYINIIVLNAVDGEIFSNELPQQKQIIRDKELSLGYRCLIPSFSLRLNEQIAGSNPTDHEIFVSSLW